MTMPKGRYYIGDLGYVMRSRWDEMCDNILNFGQGRNNGEFTLGDGTRVACYGTAHGDGTYGTSLNGIRELTLGLWVVF